MYENPVEIESNKPKKIFAPKPELEAELIKIASHFLNNFPHIPDKHWADEIPRTPKEIARWWTHAIRPNRIIGGECRLKRNRNNERYWFCPDISFNCYLLGKFFYLNAGFQRKIIEASKSNYAWHGEEKSDFEKFYNDYLSFVRNRPVAETC